MTKPKGKFKETARIYYGENFDLYWTVRVEDAKRDVQVNGSLFDAMTGNPGTTFGCHLSNCAEANHRFFPHAVHYVSFTKTRALVITKITKGKPSHAVRYDHSYGRLVDLNDTDKGKAFIKKHPELVERKFLLRKPERRNHVPGTHSRVTGVSTTKKSLIFKGALERAVNAGLIDPGLAISIRRSNKRHAV